MAPTADLGAPCYVEKLNNYKILAFAADLTGKKLIDEICHLTACKGDDLVWDQYIMPYRDISRSSVRTHGIRIYTLLGKYRVMKDLNTLRSLHTKSEYSAIHDFLEWLKEQKADSEGLILAFHDVTSSKVTPFLMEALDRHHLTDEFFNLVKGFVNCCSLAAAQPELQGKSLSLYSLARRVLNEDLDLKREDSSTPTATTTEDEKKDDTDNSKSEGEVEASKAVVEKSGDETEDKAKKTRRIRRRSERAVRDKEREHINIIHSAKFRAAMTYKLIQKLALSSDNNVDDVLKFVTGKEEELALMHKQRELALKVRSLRPIFASRIRQGLKERSRAVLLRRYLIDAAIDYETLKNAYESNGLEGISAIVQETSASKKPQNKDELVEIITNHLKSPEKDLNANLVKANKGSGDHAGNDGDSTSDSDSDEEFEEANGGGDQ